MPAGNEHPCPRVHIEKFLQAILPPNFRHDEFENDQVNTVVFVQLCGFLAVGRSDYRMGLFFRIVRTYWVTSVVENYNPPCVSQASRLKLVLNLEPGMGVEPTT